MAGSEPVSGTATFLVDGHVHLHPEFDVSEFLAHAERNLAHAAREGRIGEWKGALLFTESAGTERFRDLERGDGVRPAWTTASEVGAGALLARGESGVELLLVAGRQIRVEGKLEVLALCTTRSFPDGGRLADVVRAVRDGGGVPVIPWGFGKWWGARGSLVEAVVREAQPGELLLGDSGQRPRGEGEPSLFRVARDRGLSVLNGSDPLRLRSQVRRVGSYGSRLDVPVESPGGSAEAIARTLRALRAAPPTVGRRVSIGQFVAAQLGIRIPGRAGPGGEAP
jgi:hypothetical protein